MAERVGVETNSYGVAFAHYRMPNGTIVIQQAGKPRPTMEKLEQWEASRRNARSGMKLPRQAPPIRLSQSSGYAHRAAAAPPPPSGGCGT